VRRVELPGAGQVGGDIGRHVRQDPQLAEVDDAVLEIGRPERLQHLFVRGVVVDQRDYVLSSCQPQRRSTGTPRVRPLPVMAAHCQSGGTGVPRRTCTGIAIGALSTGWVVFAFSGGR
jgi:hypothetical protein